MPWAELIMNAGEAATALLDCGHPPTVGQEGIATGYGTDKDGKTACYECCADFDRARMIADGRITLYLVACGPRPLSAFTRAFEITNWPGTLRFPATLTRTKKHGGGFGAQRTDAWFTGPDGKRWHAVNRGDSQIARCKRVETWPR